MPSAISVKLPPYRLRRKMIEVLDNAIPEGKFHPILKEKHSVDQINVLRRINGKALREHIAVRASADDQQTTFITADLTKNPAVVPTTGGSVDTSKGVYQNSSWSFTSGNGLTFGFSESSLPQYLDNVQLNLTATTVLTDSTKPGLINFAVNGIDIYTNADITPLSNNDGTFSFFIPSISLNTSGNSATLTASSNVTLNITGLTVVTATGGKGEIDVTFQVLNTLLATVASENKQITSDFNTITSIIQANAKIFAADVLATANTLKDTFTDIMTRSNTSLINLNAMSTDYYSTTFPLLLDPTTSYTDKVAALNNLENQVTAYIQQSTQIQTDISAFELALGKYKKTLQDIIFSQETSIKDQLAKIATEISDLQQQLKDAQTAQSLSGAGLGLSLFVGIIGIALIATGVGAPLGVGVLGVAIAGAVTSAVFFGIETVKINNINQQISDKESEQANLQSQLQDLETLKSTMETVYSSISVIQNFIGSFYKLWNYLSSQLTSISSFTDKQKALPEARLFNKMLPNYQTNVAPYFNHITTVLQSYIDNSNLN